MRKLTVFQDMLGKLSRQRDAVACGRGVLGRMGRKGGEHLLDVLPFFPRLVTDYSLFTNLRCDFLLCGGAFSRLKVKGFANLFSQQNLEHRLIGNVLLVGEKLYGFNERFRKPNGDRFAGGFQFRKEPEFDF